MEPTSLNDDAEFLLPPEFLTDDDFLVEKEKNVFKGDESNLSSYELSHGFGDEEDYLTGLTRKMAQSSLEDDFSGGYCCNHAFPAGNQWGATRSSLCGARDGYGHRNQNHQTRVSSQAAWDMYRAGVEKLATMDISDESYGYNSGMGINDLPRKHTLAAAVKTPNEGTGYYSRQSLQYQKLQALQFQQLKLMQRSRGLKANNNKIASQSPSAWSNQPQRRDGSGMRAVFLGDRTGKRRSTGTGVFLPRRVNSTNETREKPTLATVLVPARVAEVLNLDESVVQPSVEALWRQKSYNGRFSSQMKMEKIVNEPLLPSDWAY